MRGWSSALFWGLWYILQGLRPHLRATSRGMPKDELIIQLIKIALGVAIGSYFLWWSLEVLKRLPLH
jgi:hypothetical protein